MRTGSNPSPYLTRDKLVVGLLLNVVVMLLAALDVILVGSILKGQIPARFGMGVFSCLWSQLIFLQRSPILLDCVQGLITLTSHLEKSTTALMAQERMRKTAMHNVWLIRFYIFYTVGTQCIIMVTFVAVEPEWHKAIASAASYLAHGEVDERHLASWLRWGGLVLQSCALLCSLVSYYTIMSLVFLLHAAAADVHDVIGRMVEASPCSRLHTALQSAVLRVSLGVEATTADMLPYLLVVVVILPLISTVELTV
ncbi:uncharacterized protein LOC117642425 [Thrips palmi]|uniref:Uncharacterized protein LOC117642425 n=1 Tax=Thrips palmi TaxID=161013 RepID=A0A6P8YHT2_THRPL|nr:uncharacterized protein LOC117642425 [Thrips palmi]